MARTRGGRRPPTAPPPPRARRVRTLVALIAGAALGAIGLWWGLRAPSFAIAVNPDRNVLLVTIDTLRADALGSYGGRASTPNLDQLAAHGARFTFAHSHAVVTLVSHATILSGRFPYETGIRDNTGYRFPPALPTAATLLKARGFATGAFIGGFPLDHRFGLSVGFDTYDDRLGESKSGGERERRADAVVASALEWIGSQPAKWFAFVHVYDPHAPYEPPPAFARQFATEPYYGEVSWTDSALGALFARLASQPRPTLVVVTGDHGESLGEHGELTHSLFAYESTLHVPLIVAEIPGQVAGRTAPAKPPRGVTIDTAVRHVDILPTLLDAVGAPAPPPVADRAGGALPGASLRGLIASGGGADRPSYFEAMTANVTRGWAPLRGVIAGREKYIDLPIAELYELQRDPEETTNVATVRTERVAVLTNILKSFDASPPGRPHEETPETLDRLRSLGYIGGAVAVAREQYTDDDDPKRLIELEQMMHRAQEAIQEGRPADAISLYRSVIARRADTEDAYRQLALVYWRQNRPADAIATLELALRNGITQSEVRIKLGQYLAESGQALKAIPLLESFAGDDPDALIALGNAYELTGRTADALRTFRHLLEVDPRNALAYQNIGIASLQAKDLIGAETALRQALTLDPSLAGAQTALGVVLETTGRKTEAIDAWRQAVQIDPSEFNALFNLTKTLYDVGRFDEAHTYGDRFIATAPPEMQDDVATIRKLLGKGPD